MELIDATQLNFPIIGIAPAGFLCTFTNKEMLETSTLFTVKSQRLKDWLLVDSSGKSVLARSMSVLRKLPIRGIATLLDPAVKIKLEAEICIPQLTFETVKEKVVEAILNDIHLWQMFDEEVENPDEIIAGKISETQTINELIVLLTARRSI